MSGDTSSNQDLWKILTGFSSLRDPNLVKEELCAKETVEKLRQGLNYYKPPDDQSTNKVKEEVKGDHLDFILLLSSRLGLRECQSKNLFHSFLSSSYRGSLTGLSRELREDVQRQELFDQVLVYYHQERLVLLRCVAHLLGHWQDPQHPYQDVYRECLDMIDQDKLIEGVWLQYKASTESKVLEAGKQTQLFQRLKEQALLLEIALLYYKDYCCPAEKLNNIIDTLQEQGFGSRQPNMVTVGAPASLLITHLNHLSVLLLVEIVDLDYIQKFLTAPNHLKKHHLLKESAQSAVREIGDKLRSWGDHKHHAPLLLAWMLFTHITQSPEAENALRLGNKALEAGVFPYLFTIVESPLFTGGTPLASLGLAIVHTLLTVTLTQFSETSLGEPTTLVAIATITLTSPRLQLEFWEEGLEYGSGVLLEYAMRNFPWNIPFHLLRTLSQHHTAHSLTHYLCSKLHTFTDKLPEEWPVILDGDDLVLTQDTFLYREEAGQAGVSPLCLPAETRGTVVEGQGSEVVVCWSLVSHDQDLSYLQVLGLLTATLFTTPGVGTDTASHPLVTMVTEMVSLVTEILRADWSLVGHFDLITAQLFKILQRYSSLPHPPTHLLEAVVCCLAVMATNSCTTVWMRLAQTGFLPSLSGSLISTDRLAVSGGHCGHILNSHERSTGMYIVTMATLELLLGVFEGHIADDNEGVLACVVWVCEEVMATCHGWRHQSHTAREHLTHKLLELCQTILESESYGRVRNYLSQFLLYSHGHHILMTTLSLGVDVVNRLLSNHHNTPPLSVESLKLTFRIIDTLSTRRSSKEEISVLEHVLATQATVTSGHRTQTHLISLIASYIHHHGDPHVPIGATKLLTQLSQISPMSVFACLGQLATPIRDAYVRRLKSRVEVMELKVEIVRLVTACVICQPGMAELFLCVQPTEGGYCLGKDSCLTAVLEVLDLKSKTPPTLQEAGLALLVSLWEARHDATLFALRASDQFWSRLAVYLKIDPTGAPRGGVVKHVMRIVAMETYYTDPKSPLDTQLMKVVQGLGETLKAWLDMDILKREQEELLELCGAMSTLFLTLCSSPHTKDVFQSLTLRQEILSQLLEALKSHLTTIAIATELSMLYLVLYRKWSRDIKSCHGNKALSLIGEVLLSVPSELAMPLYSIVLLVLQSSRCNEESLEPRYCSALIPCIANTLRTSDSQGAKFRTEVLSVLVLSEIMFAHPSDCWLQPLQYHALVTILVRRVDHLLAQLTDYEGVEAILVHFLSLAQYKEGADLLLVNGIGYMLCISLSGLASDPDLKEWREVWLLALKLANQLLHCLGHHFLSQALDFVGVHQERLAASLNLTQSVRDLPSLEETLAVTRYFQTLSQYKGGWALGLPALVGSLVDHLVLLTNRTVALLNKKAALRHLIRTMYTAGLLPSNLAPVTMITKQWGVARSVSVEQSQLDDSLVTASPAYSMLQEGLINVLISALCALRQFSPSLEAMIVDGVLDLVVYPPLFGLSLAPPILDQTTPPTLGTLTNSLTTVLALLHKVEPGSPTKYLPHAQSVIGRRAGLVCLLEQTVFLLLSQATRYLVDPGLADHDKELLKKELGSELSTFLHSLLLNFSRKGAPSPGSRVTTPSRTLTDSASSGRLSSLVFSEEQAFFRLADSFVKQFLRIIDKSRGQ